MQKTPVIAVDLGNTRAKFGFFPSVDDPFPMPVATLTDRPGDFEALRRWLDGLPGIEAPIAWQIARTGSFPWREFRETLSAARPDDRFRDLAHDDVPCVVNVASPEKVGIDRILAALGAVSYWKSRPENGGRDTRLLVVDAGSATTIDLVTTRAPEPRHGTFLGGAIVPGLEATADALARISPRLPRIPIGEPGWARYPGGDTEAALAAGMDASAIGAIRHIHEIVRSVRPEPGLSAALPIVLAGGDAKHLHAGLSQFVDADLLILIPDLVLGGIALAFRESRGNRVP